MFLIVFITIFFIIGYYSNGSADSSSMPPHRHYNGRQRVVGGSSVSSQGGVSNGGATVDEGFESCEDIRRPLYVNTTMANAWLGTATSDQPRAPMAADDDFFAPQLGSSRRAMSIGAESLHAKRAMGLLMSGATGFTPVAIGTRRRRNSEFGVVILSFISKIRFKMQLLILSVIYSCDGHKILAESMNLLVN